MCQNLENLLLFKKKYLKFSLIHDKMYFVELFLKERGDWYGKA